MSRLVEQLEMRRLFSVSAAVLADVKTIKSEGVAIKAHAAAFGTSLKGANKALAADLHSVHATAADHARLGTLTRDETKQGTIIKRDAASLATITTKDLTKVVADKRKLSAKPGDADLQAVLATDVAILQADIASHLASVDGAIATAQTLEDADLDVIAAANPGVASIQTDTAAAKATLASGMTTANSDAAILAADLTQLITDLG